MARWWAAAALAGALAVVGSGCAGGGPPASERRAGEGWVATDGTAWDAYADSVRAEMQRILGSRVPAAEGEPGLVEVCAERAGTGHGGGRPDQPFPVAEVREEMVRVSPVGARQRCAEGDLSQARMLAHQQINRLATIDRLLETYR